jgi:hypothetical protein
VIISKNIYVKKIGRGNEEKWEEEKSKEEILT